MENTKNVKALKKQLMAAIAMVCVAAVALGSSTYAWFVTNNNVKATTSEISAQSNAAFMKIKYNASAKDSDLTADVATLNSKALYPAQWAKNFDENKATTGDKIYQFETAYGTDPTANGYQMNQSTLKAIGDPDDAVDAEYAVANKFYISSKGTDLTNLKIDSVAILSDRNDTIDDHGNENLNSALRVLVVCGNNWVLCNQSGVISDSEGRTTGDTDLGLFGKKAASESDTATTQTVVHDEDTEVMMYVYYDGNDSKIYSNNLPNLSAASSKITVSFTADAQNK